MHQQLLHKNKRQSQFSQELKCLSSNWICNCFHWNAITNSIVNWRWIKPNANAPVKLSEPVHCLTEKLWDWTKHQQYLTYSFFLLFPITCLNSLNRNPLISNNGGKQKCGSISASKRREISITVYNGTWKEQGLSIIEGLSSLFFLIYRIPAIQYFVQSC